MGKQSLKIQMKKIKMNLHKKKLKTKSVHLIISMEAIIKVFNNIGKAKIIRNRTIIIIILVKKINIIQV